MLRSRKALADQVVVITGASSGIGLATALRAASRGARLVLVARQEAVLAEVRARIVAAGGSAIAVTADVGRRADIDNVVTQATAAFGGFDTWVNVAGTTIYGLAWEVDPADSERLFQTNFWGTVHGSLAAVAHLRRKGGGLVNVGSIASDFAFPMQGMYAATKHAVKGFTDALRMELAQEHVPISVSLIKPASIDTPLPRSARNYMDREPTLPPPIYPPEEVARAIVSAIEYPQREIYVGGGGKAFSIVNKIAPGLFDVIAPAITAFEKRRDPPRRSTSGLHEPAAEGRVRGDAPRHVRRTSFYTRAVTRPATTFSLIAGSVALLLGSLIAGGRRRR